MSADLEQMIRSLARSGDLNHISLSMDSEGKAWCAIFRDTIGMAPYRYVVNSDPVVALRTALTSIGLCHDGDTIAPDRDPKTKRKYDAARKRQGDVSEVDEWKRDTAERDRRHRDDSDII